MLPDQLQNPEARETIWSNLERMLTRRGYKWVDDGAAPAPDQGLLPDKFGFLGWYHRHAVCAAAGGAPAREPVYVAFFSKLGDPSIRALEGTCASRHVIFVADNVTSPARAWLAGLRDAPASAPANAKQPASGSTAGSAGGSAADSATGSPDTKHAGSTKAIPMSEVRLELFASRLLMFDILATRALCDTRVERLAAASEARVCALFRTPKTAFPRMLAHDPLARYIAPRPGDLVRFHRLSATAGEHTTYRYVPPSRAAT